MGTQTIIYNTRNCQYATDLLGRFRNPEYEAGSHRCCGDDSRVVIRALLTLGYDVNDTDRLIGKEKLLELMPNIRVFDSDSPKLRWQGYCLNG